jgi:hypothetical protein
VSQRIDVAQVLIERHGKMLVVHTRRAAVFEHRPRLAPKEADELMPWYPGGVQALLDARIGYYHHPEEPPVNGSPTGRARAAGSFSSAGSALSRRGRIPMRPSARPSRRERIAGVALFLSVTAGWMVGFSISFELGWIGYHDSVAAVATILSAVTLVITGYFGRYRDALWLGWIPGVAAMTSGWAMTPEPGGDETGWTMIFFGGLLLIPAWPLYFFPLMALGTWLGGRWRRRSRFTSRQSEAAVTA